jgi:hypothetical protein
MLSIMENIARTNPPGRINSRGQEGGKQSGIVWLVCVQRSDGLSISWMEKSIATYDPHDKVFPT